MPVTRPAGTGAAVRMRDGVVELAVGGSVARWSQVGKVHTWSRIRAANAMAGLGVYVLAEMSSAWPVTGSSMMRRISAFWLRARRPTGAGVQP